MADTIKLLNRPFDSTSDIREEFKNVVRQIEALLGSAKALTLTMQNNGEEAMVAHSLGGMNTQNESHPACATAASLILTAFLTGDQQVSPGEDFAPIAMGPSRVLMDGATGIGGSTWPVAYMSETPGCATASAPASPSAYQQIVGYFTESEIASDGTMGIYFMPSLHPQI